MKKVFLTGASSGIGWSIAQALTAAGHEVWGTSRNAARIPEMERLHAVALDLSDARSIENAFAGALAEAGVFDVLINNAGSGHFGPAESLPNETLRSQFELGVFGHIALCQLALGAMQLQGRGLIINITSLASRLPVPFMPAYNAAKAAMASWTMTLQLELGDSPIRVVDLQPGDICTDFNDAVRKDETREPRYQTRVARAWAAVEKNMQGAPKPELVARRVLRLLEQVNPPPRVTVGDPFQAQIAPAIFALFPPRVRIWGLRKFYGI